MINELSSLQSDFFTCITVKKSSLLRQNLINPLVKRFFDAHGINNYKELPIEDSFSDLDFEKLSFDVIYTKLLSEITKNNDGITIPIRFILTIDKENCSQKCEKTKTFYDTIKINDTPFLYFLYIDLSEVLLTIRMSKKQ